MKTVPQLLLLPSILCVINAEGNRCNELNLQVAALQSGDSCTLFNTIVNNGDILAGELTDVHATCGVHLENVEHLKCVEEVVKVVANITDEGCEVTGGTTVSNFIYTLNEGQEGFASLTELACKGQGECYEDIKRAIDNCNENPTVEDCMNYATCDCLMDFLSVIGTLSGDAKEASLKLESSIGKMENSVTNCRCEDLISRASSLEVGPSCALSSKIVQDGDILAGDSVALADTCNAADNTTCVEDVEEVINAIIEYGCETTGANGPFIYGLHYSSDDFNAITDFACNNDCYSALRTCQEDDACLESLSCDCMRDFLSIVDDLSPDSQDDFLKLDATAIKNLHQVFEKCVADAVGTDTTVATESVTAATDATTPSSASPMRSVTVAGIVGWILYASCN